MSAEDPPQVEVTSATPESSVPESSRGRYWTIELGWVGVTAWVLALLGIGVVVGVLLQRNVQTGIDWTHVGEVISNFGPAATVTAALVALAVGLLAWGQKRTADARDQFWKRLQWTLEKLYSDEPQQRAVGNHMLAAISQERHARKVEDKIILAASLPALDLVPTENPDEEVFQYVGETGNGGGSE